MSRNVPPILYNPDFALMLIVSFILHSNHKGLPMYSVLLILLQCLDLCFELVDEDEDLAPRVSGSDWLVVTRVTSDHCSGPGSARQSRAGATRSASESRQVPGLFKIIADCL